MRRGEVRWYEFPKPDKKRPVLVLPRDSVLGYLNEVTVAPVTRTARDIPSEVPLSEAEGMPRPCVVNCDHLQTVSKGKIGALITTLGPQKRQEVSDAIAFALDVPLNLE